METLNNLNKQQKEAVTHGEGPLLIVAGAGTGKTTVVTSRIFWLIDQDLAKPDEILALTFTEKAAEEMEERVDKMLPYGYVDLWISTFHSFCERILKQHALDIGLPNDFKLLNETDQWLLVCQNLDKFNLDYYRPLGNPTKFIHALIKHFSRCKDEAINPANYLEYAEKLKLDLDVAGDRSGVSMNTKDEQANISESRRLEEIANAYHIYQQLLLDNEALDFGDLINYTLKLFRERPAILQKYQQQFKYVLVDEFQDTNWAQYELVKSLLDDTKNLTVVGDDDQSVYKFRGASVSNILNFITDFPKAKELVLTENYRSAQGILDLSHSFIQLNNPNRLECRNSDNKDFCINKSLNSNQDYKAQIEHLQGTDLIEEVNLVMNKIIELKKDDPETGWSDFAILVRANNTAEPFVTALARANIPYLFYALRGLYSKSLILDIMAWFKLLDDYHEASALYRVLNSPTLGINYKDFSVLAYQARRRAESLFDILKKINLFKDLEEKTYTNVNKVIALVDKYSQLAKEKNISEIYLGLLQDSDYLKHLTQKESRENQKQLSYLNQFYQKIKEFESDALDPKLKDFIQRMELEINAGEQGTLKLDLDSGPDMVKVMTIHSSKGLEFKYVFIVGMVDKRFPTIQRKDPIQIPDELIKETLPEGDIHLQEERRLFYVAMTRAKQGLFLSSAQDYGGARKKKVSRFITELEMVQDDSEKPKMQNQISLENTNDVKLAEKKDESSKEIFQIPKHFSFSQLAAFNTCPLQYKYNFLLKIPIHGKGVFSFGKTMHGTLQKFFQLFLDQQGSPQASLFDVAPVETGLKPVSKPIPTLDDLLKLYEESWIDEWYESPESKKEYKAKGKQILKDLYAKHQDHWPKIKELERGFNLKIGDYTIRGQIDRIDELEDGVEIVDYKTGSVKKEGKLSPDDKMQLLLYQMAAEEVFGLKPTTLTFYYLSENKPISFLGSEEDKIKLKEKILDQIEQIKQSNFQAKPSMLCTYCDFKDICEYRKV